MFCTSAEANKLLKKLMEEEEYLKQTEAQDKSFQAALGEDINAVRPEYDFHETKANLNAIQTKIRKVKHAINVFNTKTVVADGMTIDEVLIRLPQLNNRKVTLGQMMMEPQKKRSRVYGNGSANVIDYTYANYDPHDAKLAYDEVCDELDRLQLALDAVNTKVEMEINL